MHGVGRGGVGGGRATWTPRLGKVSFPWWTCCDLEQTLPLPGPRLPELKCEKVLLVVSTAVRAWREGGAFHSSFSPKSPPHPVAPTHPPSSLITDGAQYVSFERKGKLFERIRRVSLQLQAGQTLLGGIGALTPRMRAQAQGTSCAHAPHAGVV